MKSVHEVLAALEQIASFSTQEPWDNSGVICAPTMSYEQLVVSIDVDEALIASLVPNTLLITHHPLIFSKLSSLNIENYPDNLLMQMVKKNITNIAMHTNFDKSHLNHYVAQEVLGLNVVKSEEFLLDATIKLPFDTLVKQLKEALQLSHVKVVKMHDFIESASLCTGAGASLLDELSTQCLLTGDVKYHDAMKAEAMGKSIIDIGHYESEHFFAKAMQQQLQKKGFEAIIAHSKNPFSYS